MHYIATIRNVREICLSGAAELEFWKAQLAPLGLAPVSIDGHAQLLVSAVALKWLGISFREMSIAVQLESTSAATDCVYLAGAFNTSRVLAWCERAMFQTPYVRANIHLNGHGWSFELRDDDGPCLTAVRRSTASTIVTDEPWSGAIYLPPAGNDWARRRFHARLTGLIDSAPFDPAVDHFSIQPVPRYPAIGVLAASRFTPLLWRMRPDAIHARSATETENAPRNGSALERSARL